MLNKVILSGRIAQPLELRQTGNGTPVLQFNLAVQRNFARQGEERQTDFITCVAWNKTAEFINRYFTKGRSIAIVGNLRSRTYEDKNGTKHYVTEVFVDEAQFTFEPKASNNGYGDQQNPYGGNSYGGGYGQPMQQQAPVQQAPAEQKNDNFSFGNTEDFLFSGDSDDGVPF